MIALRLLEVKQFMQDLLLGDSFDSFLFSEGSLTLDTTYTFEGRLHKDYCTEEELLQLSPAGEDHIPWKYMKNRVYSLMRGRRTPLELRLTLLLSPEQVKNVFPGDEDVLCLLTVRFSHGQLSLVTGISRPSFTMDRSAEHLWDDHVRDLLKSLKIPSSDL